MNENKSFFDSKTLLAIVVTMSVWFGWQYYLNKKYPNMNKPVVAETVQKESVKSKEEVAETLGAPAAIVAKKLPPKYTEETLRFDDDEWGFVISSKGMGLKDLVLKKFHERDGALVRLGSTTQRFPFQTKLIGETEPVDFHLQKKNDYEYVGQAQVKGVSIVKTLKIDSAHKTLEWSINVSGALSNIQGITNEISQDFVVQKETRFGSSLEHQEFYVAHETTDDRDVTTAEKPVKKHFEKVSVAALGSRYFSLAAVDDSDVLPNFRADFDSDKKVFYGDMNYPVMSGSNSLNIKFKGFAGPKSAELLQTIDPKLSKVINYGWFSWIAHPLLKLLNVFYSVVRNYGVAIILLTLLVRLLVMPFNIMSYKSMKAMQAIQPQLQNIREKYKGDPQTLNRETMNLMRQNKANPLGGCLPMFLQLPVFVALYNVLGQSIELYQEPFMLWIKDLSSKDPYYILPVLMGITMFVQQKLTPTTMPPEQARVMQFMPIIFCFLMISLPSGLTLYIFISTLFGIIQQMMFMRDKTMTAVAAK